MSSYKELLEQKAELDAELERLRLEERGEVIVELRKLMTDYQISIDDIVGSRKGKPNATGNGSVPAKYRDPRTGATWSGRGKPPGWIKDAADRDSFLIS